MLPLVVGIWTVGNEVPCLMAVEACSAILAGSNLACIALWGLHGVLALELPELGVGGLRASSL
jgi:hypothetical protein